MREKIEQLAQDFATTAFTSAPTHMATAEQMVAEQLSRDGLDDLAEAFEEATKATVTEAMERRHALKGATERELEPTIDQLMQGLVDLARTARALSGLVDYTHGEGTTDTLEAAVKELEGKLYDATKDAEQLYKRIID